MLKNYLLVALRNIFRHRFYAALNIAGLAFGLTAFFLISLYVYDEIYFDRFHHDFDNIYHVGLHANFGGQEYKVASSDAPLAAAMMNDIPGVEQATRIMESGNLVMKYQEFVFNERKVLFADSNFFEFFTFKLLEGDAKTALKEPHSIVMTTATAIRYFGDEPAIGKIISVGKENEAFRVTGVAEQAPANSHIQFDMLISAGSDKTMRKVEWGNLEVFTYYKKSPATELSTVDDKLKGLIKKHIAPKLEEYFGESFESFEKKGGIYTFFSYPLSESHLYRTEIQGTMNPNGDIRYVYIMSAVGLFILIIACINFMNLSTARSASRAKEVGLRKTLGSVRSRLVIQFLSESFVYVFAATLIALGGVYITLPSFNMISGKALSFATMVSPSALLMVALIFMIVALLAGSYPAFYLTSFNPIDVLKGKVSAGMKSKGIRSGLVVMQFTISIALIICTLVVHHQLGYMQKKDMGLDKQNILIIKYTDRLGKAQDAFVNAVRNETDVEGASFTTNIFLNNISSFRAAGTTRDVLLPNNNVDYHYLDVLKIKLLKGRYFSRQLVSDSTACVVNEAAVKEFGWADPIGQKLTADNVTMNVIGVVKDFNFESMRVKIKPLIMRLTQRSRSLLVRYRGNPKDAVALMEEHWKKISPGEPFEYSFLDQDFDKLFQEEQRLGQLFTVMSGIAIFVACLGLLGLASFTAEQRTREIGIRKVMGASVVSVNALLSKEFMILVAISFVIACTAAWYAMDRWLETFAYRIELGVGIFLLAGVMAALIAWITVSYHFIRAARSNPVDALRCE